LKCFSDFTGALDASIQLWRTDQSEPTTTIRGHKSLVFQVVVGHNCTVLPSTNFSLESSIYDDLDDITPTSTTRDHTVGDNAVGADTMNAVDNDNDNDSGSGGDNVIEPVRYACVIISISYDRKVIVWDAETGKAITGMQVSTSAQ